MLNTGGSDRFLLFKDYLHETLKTVYLKKRSFTTMAGWLVGEEEYRWMDEGGWGDPSWGHSRGLRHRSTFILLSAEGVGVMNIHMRRFGILGGGAEGARSSPPEQLCQKA